jgi:hypothetical protein
MLQRSRPPGHEEQEGEKEGSKGLPIGDEVVILKL